MNTKISILSLGILLSMVALNACEGNNPDVRCNCTEDSQCGVVLNAQDVKNIKENAVLDYLRAEQTKQAEKNQRRNDRLVGAAIGVGSTLAVTGVALIAVVATFFRGFRLPF